MNYYGKDTNSKSEWLGPVAIGGGGSGTRVVAEIFKKVNFYINTSDILYFQRNTTGILLTSSINNSILFINSLTPDTLIPLKKLLAILLKNASIRFNQEPCFGVNTNLFGNVSKYFFVSFDI